MAASPAVMQQMAQAQAQPQLQQAAPAQSIQQVQPQIQAATPSSLPPVMPTPAPAPQIGGEQSLTPGQIIFTEYQARVFNQTEAMYKTSGFLGISLFEDSYLLSKATANYIVGNIGLAGTMDSINPSASQRLYSQQLHQRNLHHQQIIHLFQLNLYQYHPLKYQHR